MREKGLTHHAVCKTNPTQLDIESENKPLKNETQPKLGTEKTEQEPARSPWMINQQQQTIKEEFPAVNTGNPEPSKKNQINNKTNAAISKPSPIKQKPNSYKKIKPGSKRCQILNPPHQQQIKYSSPR